MSMITDAEWILRPRKNKNAKIRLFCFPYAGSSSSVVYKFIVDNLHESVEVCLVELPGRGSRIRENLISEMDVIVNSISKEMKDYLDIPYVFFGHSMGALISFELAHKVKIMYNSQPHKLYISSHRVPSIKRESKIIHSLEDAELKSELIRMNGMNKEIYENDELMEIFLPIIRNDYRLCETYEYPEREKLGCKITALGGNSDYDIGEEHLKQWSNFTNSKFHLQMFEGDHFFLLKNQTEFIRQFVEWLNEDVNSIRSL